MLAEIKKNTKDFMFTQFEHSKFFNKELKENSTLLDAIGKQLDDANKEVANIQSQFALTEKLPGKFFDAQTTLVNQVVAKPESLAFVLDEDIKMIGVTPIEFLFCDIKLNEKGTE